MRVSLLCLAIGLPLLALPALAANVPPDVAAGQKAYETAFAAKDAVSIAQMWTPNGTYVDAGGKVTVGRAGLQDLFARYFKAQKAPEKIALHATNVEPMADAMVEHGTANLLTADGKLLSTSPYIAIHRKNGDKWLVDHLIEGSPIRRPGTLGDK
jgi:uncharacterized protein (TIGR02246 family)